MNISLLVILYILSWTKECDVNPRSRRVVGGTRATKSQFPFEIAVVHKEDGLICGGSIIASKWIITAAHCFSLYKRVVDMRIVAGDVSLNLGIKYKIFALIIHDDFGWETMEHDIALIRTTKNIMFGKGISPIGLESAHVEVIDCIALGWGRYSLMDETPNDKLHFIKMKSVVTPICAQTYIPFAGNIIKESNICAKANASGIGMCCKDSGGALVARNKLLGVLSFGAFCGSYPSVFTRVSSYQYWIYSSIRNFHINIRKQQKETGKSINHGHVATTTTAISIYS